MKRAVVLLVGVFAGAAVGAPPAMKPGLWEITTTVAIAGMPQGMPPTKIQHCYRAADIKDLRRTLPKQSNCKVVEWQQSGNTISYKMTCSGEAAGTMIGRLTYASDRYHGVGKISMNQGGHVMQMTQKYDARRIGDCK